MKILIDQKAGASRRISTQRLTPLLRMAALGYTHDEFCQQLLLQKYSLLLVFCQTTELHLLAQKYLAIFIHRR